MRVAAISLVIFWRIVLTSGALASLYLVLALVQIGNLGPGLQCDHLDAGGLYCWPVFDGPIVLGPSEGIAHD
jgi:hypothetical protein